jgi:signal transduction histidine kinase
LTLPTTKANFDELKYLKVLMQKKLTLFIWLFIVPGLPILAQLPAIDAIKQKIAAASTDHQKLLAIMDLTKYRNSLNGDTARFYFSRAKALALQLNDKAQLRWAEYSLLAGELARGKTDSIIPNMDNNPVFGFAKKDDPALYYKLKLLRANALNRLNERAKAIDLQLQLLNEAEKDNDVLAQVYALNYIGATHINLKNYKKAKASWQQALQLINSNPSPSLNEIETTIYSNLSLYYHDLLIEGKNKINEDSFIHYTNITIENSTKNNIYWLLPPILSFRGDYYGSIGAIAKGKADFQAALAMHQKIGDPLYITNSLLKLGSFYYSQQQYDSAIATTQQAHQVVKKAHLNEFNISVFQLLSLSHKAKGDYQAYSQSLEQFIFDADTAVRMNAAEKIAEITTKYEVQKKEATIANQSLQLAKRLNYTIAALAFLAILLPTAFFYVRNMQRKQQIKNKQDIETAEANERKRIAAELHDNMGVQANAILHNSSLLTDNPIENEKLVQNLQATAKEMLGNLRETVWALKGTEVTGAETWLRLVNFTQQLKRSFGHIHFDISGENPGETKMTSIKALHIIMVVKEAVTNAIKHAHPSTISISGQLNDHWQIQIKDDGRGFDPEAQRNKFDSNGLQNMTERAIAGHFKVAIDSQPGKGSSITLII